MDEVHDSRYYVHQGLQDTFRSARLHGDKSGKRTVGRVVSHCSAGLRAMVECYKSSVLLGIATMWASRQGIHFTMSKKRGEHDVIWVIEGRMASLYASTSLVK